MESVEHPPQPPLVDAPQPLLVDEPMTAAAQGRHIVRGVSQGGALRLVHAWIHVTHNNVIRRFYVYIAGAVVLMVMWAVFAVRIIAVQGL